MDPFQLLSRGGVQFNKNRFKNDVELFNKKPQTEKRKEQTLRADDEIPAELDFFKYAAGGSAKRKAGDTQTTENKRQKIEDEDEDEDEETTAMPRHRVTSKGNNVPEPVSSFKALKDRYDLSAQLLSNLTGSGYKAPTAIQSHGIPILLEKRDLAAISPTGTGKTLSYLLPIFGSLGSPSASSKKDYGNGIRAVIVAPTRELAHQIHNECLKLAQGRKWRIVLFSKATASTLSDKNVRDKVDILVTTPLRLVSSLQSGNLELSNARHLVLDEADRMLEPEFLTQIQEIVAACSHDSVQKAVFSATLPANAEKMAMEMMRDPIRIVVGLKDTPLPLIAQSLTYVADEQSKLPSLLAHLSQPYNPPVLVFTSTQPRATSLAEELILNGVSNVDCLHAGMSKKEREDALSRMRRGESWVMITTEVMARGMDFKGVREVINYDFPQSVQSYVHRIGRTGRAGKEGKAVTYFTDEDGPYLKVIANILLQSGSPVPEWITKLPKPSKMRRKQMGKTKKADIVNFARKIGRADEIKKSDMIAGSKRRKAKAEAQKAAPSHGNEE